MGSKKPQATIPKTTLVPFISKDLLGNSRILRKVGSLVPFQLSRVFSIEKFD
jgi:hypothetical protein